jgi:hypothetical protein
MNNPPAITYRMAHLKIIVASLVVAIVFVAYVIFV